MMAAMARNSAKGKENHTNGDQFSQFVTVYTAGVSILVLVFTTGVSAGIPFGVYWMSC